MKPVKCDNPACGKFKDPEKACAFCGRGAQPEPSLNVFPGDFYIPANEPEMEAIIRVADELWAINEPCRLVHFCAQDGTCTISINADTGKVTLADGLTLDDASRLFWEAVESMFPRREVKRGAPCVDSPPPS